MTEHPDCVGWGMESKKDKDVPDEWACMIAYCMKQRGKPPIRVYAGYEAAAMLAPHMPDGVKLLPCANYLPRDVHMEVEGE
jgi:hypothetical protein